MGMCMASSSSSGRFLFKQLNQTRTQYFVVDCAADRIEGVLRSMLASDLLNEYTAVVFTSLDFQHANLSALNDFPASEANVTGFRMVDTGSAAALRYLREWEDVWDQGARRRGGEYDYHDGGGGGGDDDPTRQSIENHPLSVSHVLHVSHGERGTLPLMLLFPIY